MRWAGITPIFTCYLFIDTKTVMGAQAKSINRDGPLAVSGYGQQGLDNCIVDLRPVPANGDVVP
jgi:hypothetical protein